MSQVNIPVVSELCSSQPAADEGLVTRIVAAEVALEIPFFSWNHNRRDQRDRGNERYDYPKIIQPDG